MSANNWTVCPNCIAKLRAAQADAQRRAAEAYGKVSAEEYHAILKTAPPAIDMHGADTLREDYSIRMGKDGQFRVSYLAACTACNWTHRFERTERAKLEV